MSIRVTESGIEVPEEYQDERNVVIRTPTKTMDISSGFSGLVDDGMFPLVTCGAFEDIEQEDVSNPSLVPNWISFKAYGEEAERFEVETE